jgi:hypothetical protein
MDFSSDSLVIWKTAAVALWFLLFFAGERLAPAAPWPVTARPADTARPAGGLRRLGRNLALWLVNAGLSPLIVVPLSFWASEAALDWRPEAWSGWPGLLADLVVLLSALARAAVIYLLGFPFSSILAFEALLLMATLFHHSNLRLPAGLEAALSLLIITPSIHWVHHHARQSDTDSNYGTVFSFWDRLFASRSATPRVPGMEIGVQDRPERPLAHLVVRPFLSAEMREAP